MHIAITQSAAEWLLPKVGVIEKLSGLLPSMLSPDSLLVKNDFFGGPIRIAMSDSKSLIAIWHVDFLTGTGSEEWGFIKATGQTSLETHQNVTKEVLERCFYVINQRLQALVIDGAMIHRVHGNGAHTLLAGRGSVAHSLNIGYYEKGLSNAELQNRAIVCVGPTELFSVLSAEAEKQGQKLPELVATADELATSIRSKAAAGRELYPDLLEAFELFEDQSSSSEFAHVEVVAGTAINSGYDSVRYLGLTYGEWVAEGSPLGENKRRIISANPLEKHPLRILGPGGSGKTLLMQLLVSKHLIDASKNDRKIRLMYIVHSDAMRAKVLQRLQVLLNGEISQDCHFRGSSIVVTTLSEYCRIHLDLEIQSILDADADSAKQFQLEQVRTSLEAIAAQNKTIVEKSKMLKAVLTDNVLLQAFSLLVSVEISAAIKGHGLEYDRKRYVQSAKNLSILHANLNEDERNFIFDVFSHYHATVFEGYAVLDTDDMALSLLGRLRTPVWQLRKKQEGFDYVFVDEAQLFNENERRIFPLLAKQDASHIPIALALDQAQATFGQTSAGLGTIGIKDITNERLSSIHRSTNAIINLAFFIIQRSTDLFGPDFPNFAEISESLIPNNHPKAKFPKIEIQAQNQTSIGKFIRKRIGEMRRSNYRQIGVICHADKYWDAVEQELSEADLPFQVIRERGAKFPEDQPLVSLCRPAQVGGQEFDAVIIIGLEQGLVPPRSIDNEALATAVEQQAIRDMYLSITRARYSVVFAISTGGVPNSILQQAIASSLITTE